MSYWILLLGYTVKDTKSHLPCRRYHRPRNSDGRKTHDMAECSQLPVLRLRDSTSIASQPMQQLQSFYLTVQRMFVILACSSRS